MTQPRLFLDACVFVAAAASSRGASALILEMGAAREVDLIATQHILREAERNIKKKLGDEALASFYRQLSAAHVHSIPLARPETVRRCEPLIDSKDVHVLAAALDSRARILLTLDRKHFMTPRLLQTDLGIAIRTPGDFIRQRLAGR